jgi:hypothetical protein
MTERGERRGRQERMHYADKGFNGKTREAAK